jgi:hypothetical protein
MPVSTAANMVSALIEIINNAVRFQILTATSMKMTVMWDVGPCSLSYHPYDGAASTSLTSVNFYQTTRRSIPESSINNAIFTSLRKQTRMYSQCK